MTEIGTDHPPTTVIRLVDGGAVATLRESTEPTWRAAVEHRFVRELFAGTVVDEVMAKYLTQDYQFFESFLSMLGACVAHADELEPRLRFAKQLGFLEADEDSYFVRALAEVGVPAVDYADPVLTEPTAGFRDLMDSSVTSASYAQLLVVLIVAEWLYLDWGERDESLPERDVHVGWIELHRGTDFREWVQFLVDELERVYPAGEDTEAAEARARLDGTWRAAVDLELAFFDEAYR